MIADGVEFVDENQEFPYKEIYNSDSLIIDERKGRNEAKKQGLKITGILGIILAAKEKGFIDLVQPLLDDLMVNGFWLNKSLYHEVLVLANEKNT